VGEGRGDTADVVDDAKKNNEVDMAGDGAYFYVDMEDW
jgi:hypothetical protein